MTPKEKAVELVDKLSKQCALIAVDEIINNNSKIPGLLTQDTMRNTWYWQEVKQEIETLR